jgi:hypothetical protein
MSTPLAIAAVAALTAAAELSKRGSRAVRRMSGGTWSDYDEWMTPTYRPPNPPSQPEFRSWFGESKVLSSDGTPKIVYHGTFEDFSRFDLGRTGERTRGARLAGPAAYFSDSMKIARGYGDAPGGRVLAAWLRIENPREVDAQGGDWREWVPGAVRIAQDRGNDGVIIKNVRDYPRYWYDHIISNVYVVFNADQVWMADTPRNPQ